MSCTIVDGPAGVCFFEICRAPKLLRLVKPPDGEWLPLDKPGDEVESHEQVIAYERFGEVTDNSRDRNRRGRLCVIATYRLLALPPDKMPTDGQMRHQKAWEAWCKAYLKPQSQTLFSQEPRHAEVHSQGSAKAFSR